MVKATLLRITLHAVHTLDYPDIYHAVLPTLRASRAQPTAALLCSGLTVADADALLAPLAQFASRRPRTRAEIEAMLAERLGGPRQYVWWALHVRSLAVRADGRALVVHRHYRVVAARTSQREPTTTRRCAGWFCATWRRSARLPHRISGGSVRATGNPSRVVELDSQLERFEGPWGQPLYDIPEAPRPDQDVVAQPRLLPMWDNTLLAYADRSRIIPPEYRELICRRNGNILATLLVDGRVAGVWRPVAGGIEATAFHRLDADTWAGLAAEADALMAFLADRDPAVYHLYEHWWEKEMPRAEVRILPD